MNTAEFSIGQKVAVEANGGIGVVCGVRFIHDSNPMRSRWVYDVCFSDGSEDLLSEAELSHLTEVTGVACATEGRTASYVHRINEHSEPKEKSWLHPTRRKTASPVA